MLNAVQSVTSNPITHVVYTHYHADHIGGVYLYGSSSDVTIIAHELTAYILAQTLEFTRPAPNITFATNYTPSIGNQRLQFDYRGDNHDPGNIFIYSTQQKVLILIDIVHPG